MPYVFGVDGGASNSRAVLSTLQGEVLYTANGPGVNYHECGAEKAASTLHRLFQDCLEGARARVDECKGLCFGLAGIGREKDHSILMPVLEQKFTAGSFILTSDAEIALTSGSLSDQGILIIAGTGSMVYGKTEGGLTARAGGYGPLLSDEGSGYRIGLEAMRATVKDEEGIGLPTALTQKLYSVLNFRGLDDLVQWSVSGNAGKEKIASLAPLVIRTAEEEDPVAEEILYQQADQLALYVEAVYKKLEMPERVDVILAGGILDQASFYWQIIRRKIIYLIPGAHVMAPKLEPVLGAILFGMSHARIKIDSDIINSLRRSHAEYKQKHTALPRSTPSEPVEQDSAASPQAVTGSGSQF